MADGAQLLPLAQLVAACNAGDDDAWSELMARTQPVVARACLTVARSWAERDLSVVEDLVQETYTRVVTGGLLERFEFRHPEALFGYLKVVATRLAHDHFKSARAGKRGGQRGSASEVDAAAVASPAGTASYPEPENQILLAQIEGCVDSMGDGPAVKRDLLIFQLYYRLGLSAAAIASVPSLELSAAGVESLIHRVSRQVREKFGQREKRERGAHGVL